jgi:tripartite-type tricarboxylate transporter receptor subunit TctC
MPGRRRLLGLACGTLALPAAAAAERRDAVALLVGAPPASRQDRWARGFAPFLERHWRRAVVGVLSQPGDGGLAALRALGAAPPDGRVLGLLTLPTLLARAIERGEASPLEAIRPVGAIAKDEVVLVAPAGAAPDLAALRALDPQAVLGTPPPGSAAHLAAAPLRRTLPLTELAFPNGGAARQAVLAGNVAAGLLPLPEAIAPLRDGRLVGLAIATDRRSPLLPDLATFREQGIPLLAAACHGVAVSAATPDRVVQQIEASLRDAIADPEFAAQAAAAGQTPRFLPGPAWAAELRTQEAELRRRWFEDPWSPARG